MVVKFYTSHRNNSKTEFRSLFRKAKEYLNRFMDWLIPPFQGLEFAYAGVPVGPASLTVPKLKDERSLQPLVHSVNSDIGIEDYNSYFDVGDLPKKNSPARALVEWKKDLRVKAPGDKNNYSFYVDITYAQREVDRMLKDSTACHEYIVYEGAKLVNDPEVDLYTMNLMLGAEAEDYVFMPGEELEDLFVRGSRRSYNTPWDYSKYILGKEPDLTPTQWLFEKIAYLWRKIKGSIEDDAINRPYMAHFYEPVDNYGLVVANGEVEFQSAMERILKYWDLSVSLYKRGEIGKAYYALGHLLHLIADMHVPAHVHNDIHGPTVILGYPDPLEEWVKKKDWNSIHRPKDKKNIVIWDATDVPVFILERINNVMRDQPLPIDDWNPSNVQRQLRRFVYAIAQYTYNFRSRDAEGRWDDQKRTGPLDDFECYYHADHLIPRAIGFSALMILNFKRYVENYWFPPNF